MVRAPEKIRWQPFENGINSEKIKYLILSSVKCISYIGTKAIICAACL